jgi:predicted type IV restriction endonuclease
MPRSAKPADQKKAIREARKLVEQAVKADVNEAETRKRVDRIFEWIMGYDVFKHVTREFAVKGAGETEHVDFAVQLDAEAPPVIMVELKRVGIDLSRKHLTQITSYAINAGCEWVLLTNGKEWRLYHIEFGQPPKTELLDSWNLLENDVNTLLSKFGLISYKSVKRGDLQKNWERVRVLKPDTLLSAICSADTLKIIKRNLRKDTGILVDEQEVREGISKLLNEAAGNVMAGLKTPTAVSRPHRKKRAKKIESANNNSSAA